jgi:hypothetical protein
MGGCRHGSRAGRARGTKPRAPIVREINDLELEVSRMLAEERRKADALERHLRVRIEGRRGSLGLPGAEFLKSGGIGKCFSF